MGMRYIFSSAVLGEDLPEFILKLERAYWGRVALERKAMNGGAAEKL